MKKLFPFALACLLSLTAGGCTPQQQGYVIPPPPDPKDEPVNPDPVTPDPPVNPPSGDDDARLARLGQTPVVLVYFTEYTKEENFPTLDDVRCFTHINVGHGRFVNKDTGDGGIEIKAPGPDYLRRMAAYKKSYPELKILLMIGGWGANANGFSMMARDAAKRKLFCDECVRICNEYGIDGVDLDWEYPTYPGGGNAADPSDTKNFTTLVKELRAALGPDRLITYAASDSGKYIDNKGVLEWVDYINVMTYSMGDPPYHNSPLYRSSLTKSRSGEESIEIFHAQGVPYDRMNFGVGFYGHGDGTVYPSSVQYYKAREALEKGTVDGKSVAGYNIRHWDPIGKNCYLGDASGKMYASYEDVESLGYRVEFLKKKGLLGVFAWEYREDDAEGTLRHALSRLMKGEAPVEPRIPVMGSYTRTVYENSQMEELSGLCWSKDKDFMWAVGDEGNLYKINPETMAVSEGLPHDKFYGGKYTSSSGVEKDYWYDLEGITIDPSTGDLYLAYEPKRVLRIKAPAYNTVEKLFDVPDAADMGNSGMEGITWYKGNLYLGAQTKATLWKYTTSGTQLSKVLLGTLAPGIKEVGDLYYDAETDLLWVSDSEAFKLFLFTGDASRLLAEYDVSFIGNPESVLVDHKRNCVWVGDDGSKSKIYKIAFSGL